MLIQTFVLIAAITLLSGSVLMSTFIAAKRSFQSVIAAKTDTAMNDGTRAFAQYAVNYVKLHGTELSATQWVSPFQQTPPQPPITETMCPQPAGTTTPVAATQPCNIIAVITWEVTGTSVDAPQATTNASQASAPSAAENLSNLVDEQRISATISVHLTNATGRVQFASRSRAVTVRIFDAPPYAVITGVKDSTADLGTITASEGDTGGAAQGFRDGYNRDRPTTKAPSNFTDTRIETTIDCVNSSQRTSQTDPFADVAVPGQIDYSFRQYGNQDWAYEDPCVPAYSAHIGQEGPPPPADLQIPDGPVYSLIVGGTSKRWDKGDGNQSGFPY